MRLFWLVMFLFTAASAQEPEPEIEGRPRWPFQKKERQESAEVVDEVSAEIAEGSENLRPKIELPKVWRKIREGRASAKSRQAEEAAQASLEKSGDSSKTRNSKPKSRPSAQPKLSPMPNWSPESKESDAETELGGSLWPEPTDEPRLAYFSDMPDTEPPILTNGPVKAVPLLAKANEDAAVTEFSAEFTQDSGSDSGVVVAKPILETLKLEARPVLWTEDELRTELEVAAGFLIDPQHLLTEQKREDLRYVLGLHASETPFHAHVVVLGRDQELPEGLSPEILRQNWFVGDEQMLVIYHYGLPAAAQFNWGLVDAGEVDKSVTDAFLVSCAIEALAVDDPDEQLERFTAELSVRLRRFGQRLPGSSPYFPEPKPFVFLENAETTEELPPTVAVEELAESESLLRLLFGAGLIISLAAAGIAWRRFRAQIEPEGPIFLPDTSVYPRLGAPHGGGGHAVVVFGTDDRNHAFDRLLHPRELR